MTEKFDRSKFKGAKLSKLRETKEQADKKDVRLLGGSSEGRANFLSVEEGRNEFRIMPPHNPNDPTYRPLRSAMLECELPVFEDGKETGKFEFKNKKIFIATQHGNEALRKLGKDPIETYIKYVNDEASLIDGKDEKHKFLSPIKGWRGRDGKWNWGILPSTSFVCYAVKDNQLGRLELWNSWIKEMNKIMALIEEEEDEVLDIDPFSDPDEGYPLVIKKEKNEEDRWEYTVDRVNPKKRQSWDEFCEENRVTDEQLKALYDKESLTELYVDCYTKRDFDLAINGLRLFDKKHKFNIFENDDFLSELEEIEKLVPEDEPKENSDATIEKEFEKAGNDTSKWPKPKCKKYLKAYILDSYDEDAEPYLQKVEELSLEDLRSWCELAEAGEELPEVETDNIKAPDDAEVEEENENTEDDELNNIIGRRRRRNS